MSKVFKAFGILSLFCLLICLSFSVVEAQTPRGSAQKAGQKRPARNGLSFPGERGATGENLRGELQNMLIQRLSAKGVPVLNAEGTAKILEKFRKVTSLDLATVRGVASKVGATHAVYGSLTEVGKGYSIDARLVSVKGDGSAIPIVVESKDMSDVMGSVDKVADRVAGVAVSRQVLADVRVEGAETLDPDVVLMRLSVRRGDPIDRGTVDREVKKNLGFRG